MSKPKEFRTAVVAAAAQCTIEAVRTVAPNVVSFRFVYGKQGQQARSVNVRTFPPSAAYFNFATE